MGDRAGGVRSLVLFAPKNSNSALVEGPLSRPLPSVNPRASLRGSATHHKDKEEHHQRAPFVEGGVETPSGLTVNHFIYLHHSSQVWLPFAEGYLLRSTMDEEAHWMLPRATVRPLVASPDKGLEIGLRSAKHLVRPERTHVPRLRCRSKVDSRG